MFIKTFVLLLVVGVCWTKAKPTDVTYITCRDQAVTGDILEVTADPCDNGAQCILKRGQNYTIGIKFKSNEDISALTVSVHGIFAGIPAPFPLDNPNACNNCGLNCPLKAGGTYLYSTNLYVKPIYPKVNLVAKWELVDQNKKDVICVEMRLSIVDGDKNLKKIN